MAEERSAPASLLRGGVDTAPLPVDGALPDDLFQAGPWVDDTCGEALTDAAPLAAQPPLPEVPWRCIDESHAATCTRYSRTCALLAPNGEQTPWKRG